MQRAKCVLLGGGGQAVCNFSTVRSTSILCLFVGWGSLVCVVLHPPLILTAQTARTVSSDVTTCKNHQDRFFAFLFSSENKVQRATD